MDLALLRTLMEVAQAGSFLAAADCLFVTQAAVSPREELGMPDRLTRRGLAGYLPGRPAARCIDEESLHLVADDPHAVGLCYGGSGVSLR